jgi:hypothetical protein
VSAVMLRCPLMIAVTRFTGTSIWRDSSAAEMASSRNSSARCAPGWYRGAHHVVGTSVIIDNLDMNGARRAERLFETNPPLVVDADAVLTRAVASERLQPVARKRSEVGQALAGVQPIQPCLRLPGEAGKLPDMFTSSKALGYPVAEADDHVKKPIRKLRLT